MRKYLPKSLRVRLWTPRGALDHSLAQLGGTIASLTDEVAQVRSDIAELSRKQAELAGWQSEVRTRARRTQALTARVYEELQEWPALLARAREEPSYALAYDEPEPLVTAVIPTYHSPDTLCDTALASVLAQTYRNWEAVVVGDHCTDDTAERVQAINDPRVRFHNLPVRQNDPSDPYERYARKGTFAGRVGVTLSRGRWIAPLSHDDAWDPDHIATLLAVAREERAEVAYGRARQIDAEGRPSTPFGAWPPRYGQFMWQTAIYHGDLRFIQLDPVAELVSEPNDWNLARRAWDAGVRFTYVDRETVTVYTHDRVAELQAAYAALGLTLNASAMP